MSLTPNRILLLDLDNCPRQIESLPQNLPFFSRILVCYAGPEPRVPLSLLNFLAGAIQE